MDRLPGRRVMSKCWEGPLSNFEIVCFQLRLKYIPELSQFPIFPSPGLVEEVRYSTIDFPQERNRLSEIQQVFEGSCQFLRSSNFILLLLQNVEEEKKKSSKFGSFLQLCVCDLDLAAQVLWVSCW